MPRPDPFALTYSETPDGRPIVTAETDPTSGPFATGNRRHRLARMRAVLPIGANRKLVPCLVAGPNDPVEAEN